MSVSILSAFMTGWFNEYGTVGRMKILSDGQMIHCL
jgi:hypothetical protein